MGWITVHVVICIVLAVMIEHRQAADLRNWFRSAFLYKAGVILLAAWLHRHHIRGDVLHFFSQATEYAGLLRTDLLRYIEFILMSDPGYYSGEARATFFIKWVSIVSFLSGDNYYLVSLWFSLVAFYAMWYLAIILIRWQPTWRVPVCVAFFFYPSAVFWTSGILKETLAMAAMAFIVAVFIKYWSDQRLVVWDYLLLIPAFWIAWALKYYYVAVLIPVLMSALALRFIRQRFFRTDHRLREIVLFLFIFLSLSLLPGIFHPNLRADRVLKVVVENHNQMVVQSDPMRITAGLWEIERWHELLPKFVPSLFHGLYAPLRPDFTNLFYSLAAAENVLLLLVTIPALIGVSCPEQPSLRILLLACLIYCLVLSLWMGMAVPNPGTLVRYRVGYLPFFVLMLIIAMRNTQIVILKRLSRFV